MKLTDKEQKYINSLSPGKLKKFLAKIQTMENIGKVKAMKEAAEIIVDGLKGKKQDESVLKRIIKPLRNLVTK